MISLNMIKNDINMMRRYEEHNMSCVSCHVHHVMFMFGIPESSQVLVYERKKSLNWYFHQKINSYHAMIITVYCTMP